MKVRVDQPNSPLFVELTQKSIDYLVSVIKHQIDNCGIHRKAKRNDVNDDEKVDPPTGYSYSYARKRLVKKKTVFSPTKQRMKVRTTYHRAASSSVVPDHRNTDNGADDGIDECICSPERENESDASSGVVEAADSD